MPSFGMLPPRFTLVATSHWLVDFRARCPLHGLSRRQAEQANDNKQSSARLGDRRDQFSRGRFAVRRAPDE